MKKQSFALLAVAAATSLCLQQVNAQVNAAPFWSLQGNNNAPINKMLGTTNAVSLRIVTNGVDRIRVSSTGNVGIGTIAPERRLHVFNGSAGVVVSNASAPLVVENNTNTYVNLLSPSANQTGLLFGNPGNAQDGGIIYHNTTHAMQFRTNGNVTRMTLSSAGNLDIDGDLDVDGSTLNFGTAESISDGGINIISSFGNFIPSNDNLWELGNNTNRWLAVWAVDGTINVSDERDKTNIQDLNYGMKEIMKLRATRFTWKNDVGRGEKIGLIAQELKKVLPEVVRNWEYKQTTEGGPKEKVATERMGVMYSDIIPVLIKGMQEQQQQIDIQQQQLDIQQQQIEDLKQLVSKLTNTPNNSVTTSNGILLQNHPNPVKESTTIKYSLPYGATKAYLLLTDALGRTIKTLRVNSSGVVNLDASTLSNGVYNYSLVIDGKTTKTMKLMVIK